MHLPKLEECSATCRALRAPKNCGRGQRLRMSCASFFRLARTAGGLYPLFLLTDAYNILLAIDTPNIKPPAEKSFMLNLLWLKQLLESRHIEALQWGDTRDMTADGHTKGSISRCAIDNLIRGILKQDFNRRSLSWATSVDRQGKRTIEVIINDKVATGGGIDTAKNPQLWKPKAPGSMNRNGLGGTASIPYPTLP